MSGISGRAKATQVKIRNNKFKSFGIYFIVFIIFMVGFIGVISYVNAYKKEVDVLSFNKNVVDRELIEEQNMSKLTLAERDLQDGMVRWKDREQYVGKYSAHFLRGKTPVYSDMFTEEQVLRTAYLYNLELDQELLTFPYDIANAGGKLVMPGDRLRVRGSYQLEDGKAATVEVEDGEEISLDANGDKVASDIIFDVVEVKDLLNGANESVVDVILDAQRLPQKDREDLMNSSEFIEKITPRAILMIVNTDEVSRYVKFQANENPLYTITMLTRNEELKSAELNTGNSLLDLLHQVQSSAVVE